MLSKWFIFPCGCKLYLKLCGCISNHPNKDNITCNKKGCHLYQSIPSDFIERYGGHEDVIENMKDLME